MSELLLPPLWNVDPFIFPDLFYNIGATFVGLRGSRGRCPYREVEGSLRQHFSQADLQTPDLRD